MCAVFDSPPAAVDAAVAAQLALELPVRMGALTPCGGHGFVVKQLRAA
jgi:hypothetical protein